MKFEGNMNYCVRYLLYLVCEAHGGKAIKEKKNFFQSNKAELNVIEYLRLNIHHWVKLIKSFVAKFRRNRRKKLKIFQMFFGSLEKAVDINNSFLWIFSNRTKNVPHLQEVWIDSACEKSNHLHHRSLANKNSRSKRQSSLRKWYVLSYSFEPYFSNFSFYRPRFAYEFKIFLWYSMIYCEKSKLWEILSTQSINFGVKIGAKWYDWGSSEFASLFKFYMEHKYFKQICYWNVMTRISYQSYTCIYCNSALLLCQSVFPNVCKVHD